MYLKKFTATPKRKISNIHFMLAYMYLCTNRWSLVMTKSHCISLWGIFWGCPWSLWSPGIICGSPPFTGKICFHPGWSPQIISDDGWQSQMIHSDGGCAQPPLTPHDHHLITTSTLGLPWPHCVNHCYPVFTACHLGSPQATLGLQWPHWAHNGHYSLTTEKPWTHHNHPGLTTASLGSPQLPWVHHGCPGFATAILGSPQHPWLTTVNLGSPRPC